MTTEPARDAPEGFVTVRLPLNRICIACGRAFHGKSNAFACSVRCRQRWHRQSKRAARA